MQIPKNVPQDHIALYGNVRIPKSWCSSCRSWAFVLDGELACCGRDYKPKPKHFRRVTSPPDERRPLGRDEKEAILRVQDYSCFYCERRFGSIAYLSGKERVIKIQWDHLVPFSFSQNNQAGNIAAACQFCNNWKRDLVFNSLEEAQVFLNAKWKEKQTENRKEMRDLSTGVSS
jgi:hypothetical protein